MSSERSTRGPYRNTVLVSAVAYCIPVFIVLRRYLYHFEYKKTLQPLFYRDGTGLGCVPHFVPRAQHPSLLAVFDSS